MTKPEQPFPFTDNPAGLDALYEHIKDLDPRECCEVQAEIGHDGLNRLMEDDPQKRFTEFTARGDHHREAHQVDHGRPFKVCRATPPSKRMATPDSGDCACSG